MIEQVGPDFKLDEKAVLERQKKLLTMDNFKVSLAS
jgi:hypothetical protein